jgi:hypothetical protein
MRHERGAWSARPGSRRRFLWQGAMGLAGLGIGSLATRSAAVVEGQDIGAGDGPRPGCCGDRALALYGAAFVHGQYLGFADGAGGLGLFRLVVDDTLRVSLGPRLAVDLPPGFEMAAIGVSSGRLVVAGGVPFVFESFEVDDETDESVSALLDPLPPDEPTTGTRMVEVEGLRAAAFLVDPPDAEPLALPPLPNRLAAAVQAIAETSTGALRLLVGHTDERQASRFTAAVDLLEGRPGGWTVRSVARELGESGPHYLAVQGESVVVALNTMSGARLVHPDRPIADQALGDSERIVGLLPGADGPAAMVEGATGTASLWSQSTGSWGLRGPVNVPDPVVEAIAVAGAPGQTILVGRQSTVLVYDASALAGPQ